MTPLVSVILPVFNRAALVGSAIESVLSQTYPHWELLVVDDGSDDGTRRVIESFGSRLALFSTNRDGAYGARNLALSKARGEFVAFIDSDDRWMPERLASQLPLFRPEVGLVFGNASFVDARSGPPRLRSHTYFDLSRPYRGRVLDQLAINNFIPQSSVLVRRSCFDRLGPFSRASKIACDYAKWLEISMHYEVDFVPKILFEYLQHDSNLSRDSLRALNSRVILMEELLAKVAAPEQRAAVSRALFGFDLALALADPRRAFIYMHRATARPGLTASRRLRWTVEFSRERLRLGMARLMPGSLHHTQRASNL